MHSVMATRAIYNGATRDRSSICWSTVAFRIQLPQQPHPITIDCDSVYTAIGYICGRRSTARGFCQRSEGSEGGVSQGFQRLILGT